MKCHRQTVATPIIVSCFVANASPRQRRKKHWTIAIGIA
jgi:hypothetical protein